MRLHVINTELFKLDGGAMFGVVPKSIWQKLNPADESNLCTWAMRLLLIEDGNDLILIDTGIGHKQDPKFFGHYHLHGPDTLDKSLQGAGFQRSDVTRVLLTHLHFDHCGGAVENKDGKLLPAFEKARFYSNNLHWKTATVPNQREKASFLKENILPLEQSGQLTLLEAPAPNDAATPRLGRSRLNDHMELIFMSGHTQSMMLPLIHYRDQTIVYCADLLPSVHHLPMPYVMAYDVSPLITLNEKALFLEEAVNNNYILFFEHDPVNECATLERTEKGIRVKETFPLSAL